MATATATVGTGGAVTGITITNTGSGYTSAPGVTIAGSRDEHHRNRSGHGHTLRVGHRHQRQCRRCGLHRPVVTLSGGGGTATPVAVGNALTARQYATDYATAPGTLAPVFVVLPPPANMPATGTLQSIEYFNQATTGSSPTPSAGNLFHAYVLRPTVNPERVHGAVGQRRS